MTAQRFKARNVILQFRTISVQCCEPKIQMNFANADDSLKGEYSNI